MSEGRVAGVVELVSVIEQSALTSASRGGRENTRPFLSAMLLNRSVGGSICAGGSMFDVIEASDYQKGELTTDTPSSLLRPHFNPSRPYRLRLTRPAA